MATNSLALAVRRNERLESANRGVEWFWFSTCVNCEIESQNMDNCKNLEIFKALSSSFDRIEEVAWNIRLMEINYHQSNEFRWSLNSFLRSLKEIMQILTMEVQNDSSLKLKTKGVKEKLCADPLIDYLYKQRDVVVHKSMLKPSSQGMIGWTRGNGMKLGLSYPIDPMDNSSVAMEKYIRLCANEGNDLLSCLHFEEDGSGEYSCIERVWRLTEFPDDDVLQLAASAWEKVTKALFQIATDMGAELIEPTFELADSDKVNMEIYEPEWIKECMDKYAQAIHEVEK